MDSYARAIQQAMVDIKTSGDDCVFIGEDMEVAGAFGMNMALKNAGHQEKLVDMPLCEAIIVHTGVGTRSQVCVQWSRFNLVDLQRLASMRWSTTQQC